jgi:hypothetical protein
MNKIVQHVRRNVIAYLALFVALGGTSYAAVKLPVGSVGARQIKNHSIAPVKFNRSAIGGSVRYWAKISATGKILASSPGARIVGSWFSSPGSLFAGGAVTWERPISRTCFALASAESFPAPTAASAVTVNGKGGERTQVRIALSRLNVPVNVAVVCGQS